MTTVPGDERGEAAISLRSLLGDAPKALLSLHQFMAIHCFDGAGAIAVKSPREAEQQAAMLALSLAAVHHAELIEPPNRELLVAATWQASRRFYEARDVVVCAALARLCEKYARGLSVIYAGYAFEALARAEDLLGRPEKFEHFRRLAAECATQAADRDCALALSEELSWQPV